MKKILFAASECVPFIKTGGLADVVGTLPKKFDRSKYEAAVILPYYTCIPQEYRNSFKYIHHFYMDFGKRKGNFHVGIMKYEIDGITYYFVDNEYYFGGDRPYTDAKFDIERFTFFCKAVLAIMPVINFKPDIIHCHDWQSALIPVFLHSMYSENPFYFGTKTIMTIHNLKFQGVWDIKTFEYNTDLPSYMFTPDKLEFKKDANMLKGGIVYADYVTTVSETYSTEIQNNYYGEGLDGLLRAKRNSLCGIINGIDYDSYDPEKDTEIFQQYSVNNFSLGKSINKQELQRELGLPVDKNKFMIAIISRLTDQKGLDLVNWVIDKIIDDNTQLVVLGTGDQQYENTFKHYQQSYPTRVSANIFFSENRAHKLYAAADAILVPSKFEPCGLTQLISLKYGTVPIVRETGGLKDSVEPYNEYYNTGTGFSFTNYNADEMLGIINYAKHVYFDLKKGWSEIISRGMKTNFSWDNSAKKYEQLYDKVLGW